MTGDQKPEGDLEDADGVIADGDDPRFEMEVLQKGGSDPDTLRKSE